MKLKINKSQFQLLTNNFVIIEDGLLSLDKNIITESGMPVYIVSMWVSSYNAEIRIGTHSGSGGAMAIVRKLFPSARVYSARSA